MPKRHPLPPLVTGTKCVPVIIPDSVEYAQLLVFAIRRICQQGYYERDETGTLAKTVSDNLKETTLIPLIDYLKTNQDCGDVMPNCDTIEDCLETSTIINNITIEQNSFNQFYQEIYINNDTILDRKTEEQLETGYQELPPPPIGEDCDYNALWAGCLSVVNYLDTITRDYLEKLTASFDQNVRYASNIEAIPFLAELPIDEVIEYTTYITQELENSYNATVTLEFLQTTACELFCGLKDNCTSLNPKYLLEYLYSTKLNIDWAIVSQYGLAQQLGVPIELFLAGADIVYFQWGFSVWLMSTQANFYGGRGEKNISVAYRLGLNSPDADWEILCDCLPENCGDVETDITMPAIDPLPAPLPIVCGSSVTYLTGIPSLSNGYLLGRNDGGQWYIEFQEAHCFNGLRLNYRISGGGTGNITYLRCYVDGVFHEDLAITGLSNGTTYTNQYLRFNTPKHGSVLRFDLGDYAGTKQIATNSYHLLVKDT